MWFELHLGGTEAGVREKCLSQPIVSKRNSLFCSPPFSPQPANMRILWARSINWLFYCQSILPACFTFFRQCSLIERRKRKVRRGCTSCRYILQTKNCISNSLPILGSSISQLMHHTYLYIRSKMSNSTSLRFSMNLLCFVTHRGGRSGAKQSISNQ